MCSPTDVAKVSDCCCSRWFLVSVPWSWPFATRGREVGGELPGWLTELWAGFLALTQTFECLVARREPDRQLYYES